MPRSSPTVSQTAAPDRGKAPSYDELLPHAELLRILDEISDGVMLDVGRAALVLGVSVNTLNHWRSQGRPSPFVKMGRGRVSLVRYRLGELRKFLAGNTFSDTATAFESAARLVAVGPGGFGFDAYFDIDEGAGSRAAEPEADEESGQQTVAPTGESDTTGGKPAAPPRVVHYEDKPRRDDMLDVVTPFWVCRPFVLDTALSRRADFLEHLLSERVKVEWMTWRKALGRLWLEKSVWERRMRAARMNRAGPELADVIHEQEKVRAREGVPDDRTMILKYLGLRPREGVDPDSQEATSYVP